jgi:hypothetical protein
MHRFDDTMVWKNRQRANVDEVINIAKILRNIGNRELFVVDTVGKLDNNLLAVRSYKYVCHVYA